MVELALVVLLVGVPVTLGLATLRAEKKLDKEEQHGCCHECCGCHCCVDEVNECNCCECIGECHCGCECECHKH